MKTIILIFLLAITFVAGAQNSFFRYFENPSYDRAFSAIELSDRGYIIIGESDTTSNYSFMQGNIIRLSCSGDIIDEKRYLSNTTFTLIFPAFSDRNQYLITGKTDSIISGTYISSFCFVKIDTSLNILHKKITSTKTNAMTVPWQGILGCDSSLYVYYYNTYLNPPNTRNIALTKFSLPECDSVAGFSLNPSNFQFVHDLHSIQNDSIVEILFTGGPTAAYGLNNYIQFTKDLIITQQGLISSNFTSNISTLKLSDTGFLLAGTVRYLNGTELEQKMCCLETNANHDTLNINYYSNNSDTLIFAGAKKNAALSGGKIFIAGYYNVDARVFPWQNEPSWIAVLIYDLSLNLIGEYYYGGDAVYMPYCIIPSSDSGCLITGIRYDYLKNFQNSNYELDVFALKVNRDGLITAVPDNPVISAHDAIVYPNPGSEYLVVQSGPQVSGAVFRMYDMQGRQVMEQRLTSTMLSLNTGSLAAGTYPWQIIFNNKVIESGKWVKGR